MSDRYAPRRPELLREAMEYPGRGTPYSIRKLAEAVGLPHHSTIGHLLTGERQDCDEALAKRIAEVLEVPFKLLFAPTASLDQNETDHEQERKPGKAAEPPIERSP
ncbi:hypothetical protein AB0M57_04265 [Streptomyces sp. NPDC051597]|uniref:hypothetical protein n=1 Tax=Streptomyces sp. NPDC051597 TaxID=3155049 RepID=UPI0034301EA4